jgi:hypothetical protein
MQSSSVKKLAAVGAAVLVVGVAAVGVSVVQAQSTSTPTAQQQPLRDQYLQKLADRLHVPVDQLKQAIADTRKELGLPDPSTRPNGAPGPGRRGAYPGGFQRGGFGGFFGKQADALATLFQEDRTALQNELPGKTLAEVAAVHKVTTQQVVDKIVETANNQIDQVAKNRNIPADRVNQMKQRISERAQEFVTTHRFPARGTGTRS